MGLDPTVFQILYNGGFAALFIWLLWDSRAESRRREEASALREKTWLDTLPKIVETLERIERKLTEK